MRNIDESEGGEGVRREVKRVCLLSNVSCLGHGSGEAPAEQTQDARLETPKVSLGSSVGGAVGGLRAQMI